MLKNILILLFTIGLSVQASFAQEKHTISGYIKDEATGEELIGASIIVKELTTGTTTNVYGFYSLTLPKGKYTFIYSFIGYKTINETIDLSQNIKRSIEIKQDNQQLEELVIVGEQEDQNVKEVQMSVEKLNMETIQKIPQLLGEADVIKSIQLRPGVTSVGEGASGFNVRGGNIDQNLILLDESPVYNSSHLFGFFSVFNPDAIKDAQLFKGGIPARYGGRLSSVMDVRQREGNLKKFKGQGGIGALFSRLTLEAPIKKDKASFLISARRSYADLFLKFDKDLKDNSAFFYDLNTKVNWKINERNRIFFSGYFGRDVFAFSDVFEMNWGNLTFSSRWNHLINDKWFSNLVFVYSDYGYQLGIPSGSQAFEWNSKIINYNLKSDFNYYINPDNTLEFGANALYYQFHPGRAEGKGSNSIFNVLEVPQENAWELAGYVSNKQNIGSRVTLLYGVRYSHFFNVGDYDLNVYKYGTPTDKEDIIDTISYSQNEVVADYGGFEPRLAIKYSIDDQSSIKASYQRTRQYLHLVSNTTSATPIDVWKPAGKYVKPGTSNQYAIGYFRNFKSNLYELSSEVFYKDMNNLLDYRNGAELLLNENIETEFLSGDGRAYGLELMVKKNKGKFTGWISYTLSRAESQVKGFVAGDYVKEQNGINNGDWYPTNWDKLHDISVVSSYTFNDKWEASANFIFASGRPATYPDGSFQFEGKSLPVFANRNGFRAPASHRLDVSVTLTPRKNKDSKFESKWVFGIYNLYGRKNPYSVYTQPNDDDPTITEAVQLSIIGIPVPAVTYNFKF